MKNSYMSVLTAIFLMVGVFLVPAGSSAASLVSFSVHTPGFAPIIDENGLYHMNKGIWNIIEVTLDSSVSELTVEMQYGTGDQNWTNHYIWRYSGGVWEDPLYQHYIVPENCSVEGNTYLIYAGVDYDAYAGTWNLTISSGGNEIAHQSVVVEEPRVAASFRSADFNLWVDPFVETTLDSKDYMQYFSLVNEGNVPLTYTVNYSAYEDRINTTGKAEIIGPGEDSRHYITFRTDAWSPRVLNFTGVITAVAAYRIPQRENAAHLIPSVASTFTAKIHIGYANYELYTSGDLTFQAKKKISMDYNSVSNLTVFLTGNGPAVVGINSSNCTILAVRYNGKNVSLPLQIELRPDVEKNISVTVLADVPNTTADISYDINYKGHSNKYRTEISVGPSSEETTNADVGQTNDTHITVIVFLALVVGVVVVYMLFTQKRMADKGRSRDEKANERRNRRKK